jgi:signal transduction histidine kinase
MFGPNRFLVIDDDPVTCILMQRWLKNEAVVDVAHDAVSGLKMLFDQDLEYDAVLVDQMMPGMDGMAFLEAVMEKGGEHPPILMMTASSSVNLAVAFMKAGGSDFIEKPLDPEITRLRLFRIARNYSQQREQNRRLSVTERERDVLLAAMTHDLRSPLGVISNIVTLMREAKDLQDMGDCLDLLSESSRNMTTLVDDFLVLAKDRNQVIVAKPVQVDLAVLLHELEKYLAVSLRIRSIALRLVVPTQDCRVETDANRLRQVLINLTDNALKHSGCQNIEIRLEAMDAEVKVSISDDGVGLPAGASSNLHFAFKEDSNQGGFGLGLAICSRLCRLLCSDLTYHPRAGGGAVFSFGLQRLWPRDGGADSRDHAKGCGAPLEISATKSQADSPP